MPPRLITHLYNLRLCSINLTTSQIKLVNSIKQRTWFEWICHTFQARNWLSWPVRAQKPRLTDTPCSCIGAETSTRICSITVSKDAHINRFVRPGRSYAVPAPCTIATWLLKASSTAKLARQTWSTATTMKQRLKRLLLNLLVRFLISFQKHAQRYNKWERLSLCNWSCRSQSPVIFYYGCQVYLGNVWKILLLCGVVDLNGSFTFEQATLHSFLPFVTVSKSSGKRYL